MKGNKHPKNDVTVNPSGNPSIRDLIAPIAMDRRRFLSTAAQASALAAMGGFSTAGLLMPNTAHAAPIPASNGFGGIGFESIAAKLAPVANSVEVPAGYSVEVLAEIIGDRPRFRSFIRQGQTGATGAWSWSGNGNGLQTSAETVVCPLLLFHETASRSLTIYINKRGFCPAC